MHTKQQHNGKAKRLGIYHYGRPSNRRRTGEVSVPPSPAGSASSLYSNAGAAMMAFPQALSPGGRHPLQDLDENSLLLLFCHYILNCL